MSPNTGLTRLLSFLIALFVVTPGATAAESKTDKLSSDKTQEQYTRKSITYLGTSAKPGLVIEQAVLQRVGKAVRPQVELKRFDYNSVDISQFGTEDEFIKALGFYVGERAHKRAASEAEYEERFKRARVLASDIDRVMKSAYIYRVEVTSLHAKYEVCREVIVRNKRGKERKDLQCRAGDPRDWQDKPRVVANLAGSVIVKKANLLDPGKPPTELLKNIGIRSSSKAGYQSPPRPPDKPVKPTPPVEPSEPRDPGDRATPKQKARYRKDKIRYAQQKKDFIRDERTFEARLKGYPRKLEQWRREMEVHRQRMAEYIQRLPQMKEKAKKQATLGAAGGMGGGVQRQVISIPDFQLKSVSTAALDDGVDLMLGSSEGVLLDHTYDVLEFDQSGKKSLIGYVKVRKVGNPTGSGGGEPSYAEKVREMQTFAGGEQLVEHPVSFFHMGIYFDYAVAFVDPLGDDTIRGMPGGGLYGIHDLANTFGWPEFYLSWALEYHYMGLNSFDNEFGMFGGLLGFRKKWYANNIVFDLGLHAVVANVHQLNDPETANASDPLNDKGFWGGGADLNLGLEFYIWPEFSLFLAATGRYLYLGAGIDSGTPESGLVVHGKGGLRFAF